MCKTIWFANNCNATFSNKKTKRISQQTQNICITFVQCWTNLKDVGPTLYKCYTNVLCLLGTWLNSGILNSWL